MLHSSSIFRFGDYRLDLTARELHHADALVPLPLKVFDALAWLFQNRNRAVGRDELSAAVWGKADVTDVQLDQLIRKLRRAVGDTGSDQRIIRTMPRFGYRWIAEAYPETAILPDDAAASLTQPPAQAVELQPECASDSSRLETSPVASTAELDLNISPLGNAIDAAPSDISAGSVSVLAPWRSLLGLLAGVALLVLSCILVWAMRPRESPIAGSAATVLVTSEAAVEPQFPVASMAVLPVDIQGISGSESAWLRLGIMELISARLREGGLTVVPTSNIIALAGHDETPLEPDQVHAATGAKIIISPSVRQTNAGWRLRLELQGAETVVQELELHAENAVSGARDISDRLLILLGHSLVSNEKLELADAYDALVRRIDLKISSGDFAAAAELIDRAPKSWLDSPRFLLFKAELERAVGDATKARQMAQVALDSQAPPALDPEARGSGLTVLGVTLFEIGQTAEAEATLNEAIGFSREHHLPIVYIDAMRSRAVQFAILGRDQEADRDFAEARIAMVLAADTLGLAELDASQAAILMAHGRFAEARPLLDRAIVRLERFPPRELLVIAYSNKIQLHLALLESSDALTFAERAPDRVERFGNLPKQQVFMASYVNALIRNGRYAQADRLLGELVVSVNGSQASGLYERVLANQARLALARGRWEAAATFAAQDLELLATPEMSMPAYAKTRSTSWLVRIRALHGQGAIADAQAEVQRLVAWAGSGHEDGILAMVRLAEAEQAVIEGRDAVARAAFESALASANRAAPKDVAEVAVTYGEYLMGQGDLTAAITVVGQVTRYAEQDFSCALLQVRLHHALGQESAWLQSLGQAQRLAGERVVPQELTAWLQENHPAAGKIELPAQTSVER